MATTSKRISRKQLRQPDWFQITTERALEFFTQQRLKVLVGLAAIGIVVSIGLGWQFFKTRQNEAASKQFGAALALFRAQKFREAVPEFQKVQGYRWSHYAALGYLYEANSYLSLGEPAKAAAPAERFLSATGQDTLYRQIALMTVAAVQERQNQCKQAVAAYGEAEKIKNGLQQEARLGKARCAERIGDVQGAIASYRDYLKDDPESLVNARLAELEAKVAAQAGKK
jgi:predicted negative regulator of RcsB-dependent stress response